MCLYVEVSFVFTCMSVIPIPYSVWYLYVTSLLRYNYTLHSDDDGGEFHQSEPSPNIIVTDANNTSNTEVQIFFLDSICVFYFILFFWFPYPSLSMSCILIYDSSLPLDKRQRHREHPVLADNKRSVSCLMLHKMNATQEIESCSKFKRTLLSIIKLRYFSSGLWCFTSSHTVAITPLSSPYHFLEWKDMVVR